MKKAPKKKIKNPNKQNQQLELTDPALLNPPKLRTKLIDANEENQKFFNKLFLHAKEMERETLDQYMPIIEIGIERNYPMAKLTKKFYKIMKSIEFVRPIANSIQAKKILMMENLKVNKKCLLEKSNKNLKNRSCQLLNVKMIFDNWTKNTKLNTKDEMNCKIIREMYEFSSDVFICISHKEFFHICNGTFCTKRIKNNQGISQCLVSLNEESVRLASPYDHPTADFGVYNRKTIKRREDFDKRNYKYKYNGNIISVHIKLIHEMITKIYTNCISMKDLKYLVWTQYETFNRMIEDGIGKCTKFLEERSQEFQIKKNQRRRRRRRKGKENKKNEVISKKRKLPKRKQRKTILGHFNKSVQQKIISNNIQTKKSFKANKKNFYKILEKLEEKKNLRIISYKNAISAKKYVIKTKKESEKSLYGPRSEKCRYVDPPIESFDLPFNNLALNEEDVYLLYLNFLTLPAFQRIIKLDKDSELTLRCLNHPIIKYASNEFKTGLNAKISIIKRLTPNLFRVIMMIKEIKDECMEKYALLKRCLKSLQNKNCTPNFSDLQKFCYYDYKNFFLDKSVTDVFMISIAEIMFWCERQCLSHPEIEQYSNSDLSEEMLNVGCLYSLRKGIMLNGKIILNPHPLLRIRNFLMPEHKLTSMIVDRTNVGSGTSLVSDLLIGKARLEGVQKVAFLNWKKKFSQLTAINDNDDEDEECFDDDDDDDEMDVDDI